MTVKNIKAAMISLGCSKNLVDAECMTQILLDSRISVVEDPVSADVIIVNTCGFIESAKKEAIDVILAMADYKEKGNCRYLLVTGCLVQRYKNEIIKDIPEVDGVLGTDAYQDIGRLVLSLYGEDTKEKEKPDALGHLRKGRAVSTRGFAYLKIAEGCSHRCAFCAIPAIRGRYISRPFADIIEEAELLAKEGYKEIVLVAQDTTSYGRDIEKKRMLPELLTALCDIEGIHGIRIMYTYSDGLTDELLSVIADNDKIMNYLDMPIQHGDDRTLRRMKRRDTSVSIRDSVERIRKKIPDIVLRTTVLVGFPGETEAAFQNLLDFLEELRFDRVGAFVFSPEEGTPAATMEDQIPENIAKERFERLMTLQQRISFEKNLLKIGCIYNVTIESSSEDGVFYVGRSYAQAPEVDPNVMVLAPHAPLDIGQTVPVRIVEVLEYDLVGEVIL